MNTRQKQLLKISEMISDFEKKEGRCPRILIEKISPDDPDVNTRQLASGFADLGFDVDIGPAYHTASDIAKQAVENDVHFIAIIGNKITTESLLNKLRRSLQMMDRGDINIFFYGDFHKENVETNSQSNPIKFFPKTVTIAEIAKTVLQFVSN